MQLITGEELVKVCDTSTAEKICEKDSIELYEVLHKTKNGQFYLGKWEKEEERYRYYLLNENEAKEFCIRCQPKTIDLSTLFSETAKLSELDSYIQKARELAGEGQDVVLTGAAPVWLYLKIAHALHGKAKKLIYRSPVTGGVEIFDHYPLSHSR